MNFMLSKTLQFYWNCYYLNISRGKKGKVIKQKFKFEDIIIKYASRFILIHIKYDMLF